MDAHVPGPTVIPVVACEIGCPQWTKQRVFYAEIIDGMIDRSRKSTGAAC